MAYLDRSQGITFVYTNFYHLYKKAKKEEAAKKGKALDNTPFIVKKERNYSSRNTAQSINENIERLSLAQKKLHFILGELKTIMKKPSK